MPAPPRQHAGTASQLIPGVRRTNGVLWCTSVVSIDTRRGPNELHAVTAFSESWFAGRSCRTRVVLRE